MIMEQLILHEYAPSGNCYKIRLTAALLGLPITRRHYDIMKGETRTPAFLSEVNANGSALIPGDRFEQADLLRWMFFEQYNHEPNVATMRFWLAFVGEHALTEVQRAQIPLRLAAGEAALTLMDEHLADRSWLVGDQLSLADICLYAYTHVAGEGGFALERWPAVKAWLARVAAQPAYVELSD
jgi:glutathione S-transferase